ncbi:hypothetical protein P7H06_10970 [Paenibacillus larvae]|nr:hypothetical protein [Paenibacillus larvae]MDT2259945.1 hypothetical protein [Paenibacillus larvae]
MELYDQPQFSAKSGFSTISTNRYFVRIPIAMVPAGGKYLAGEKWIDVLLNTIEVSDKYINYDNFKRTVFYKSDMFVNLQSSKEDLQKYYDDLAQLQKKLTFF